MKGIDDGKTNIERLNEASIRKLFNHYTSDRYNEKTTHQPIGLDFRAYYVLTAITDAMVYYGQSAPGTVNEAEFLEMLEAGFLPDGAIRTIDSVQMMVSPEDDPSLA